MRSKSKIRTFKNFVLLMVGTGIVVAGIIIIWVSTLKLPDFKSFTERKIANSTKIYDRTGEILLYDVHKDFRRTVIPYEDMGSNIKNAVVAIEDSEFYNHNGIRIKSIIRALSAHILNKSVKGGGSTITQQLIKNTLLTREVSVSRKVKEWILAIKLEKVMSKEEILALYLNESPYGGTIYGIQEASKNFFNKNPRDLTLAESAYLAAIPNSPTYYSPYKSHKDKLDERKNLVLSRMRELNFITEKEYQDARAEVVVFLPEQPTHIAAPHFVFFVKSYLEKKYGADALDIGGLKITTTLDYELQKKSEEIISIQAKENEKLYNGKNAASVVIDPTTGQILSMVGSRDYFDREIDGNFNVATALRQPGSSFKPFVYALAFNKGFTAETVLIDAKTEFSSSCDGNGNPKPGRNKKDCYMPDNFDNANRGPLSLRSALAESINVVAVKLLYLVGVNDSIELAHQMGITSLNEGDRYGLSLVIGGGEVTLLDITSAYGVFATEGIRHPYKSILKIEDRDGKILEEFTDEAIEVLPQNTARMISSILSDNTARIPTFGANSSLVVPGVTSAVKTGTTNSNRDAWTVGYTPNVAVGVWVGNNDNKEMKKGGVALAGPIWNKIMVEAVKNKPKVGFNSPDQLDETLPPILRGFWQGGETFTGPDGKETSITNIHTILYWINKNNITGGRPSSPESDPLYGNWEYAVQNWWAKNSTKYKTITQNEIPINNNQQTTPIDITIEGITDGVSYLKNTPQKINFSTQPEISIKKIDIFINNIYVTSLKSTPSTFTFTPNTITGIKDSNMMRVIIYDASGKSLEKIFNFYIQ